MKPESPVSDASPEHLLLDLPDFEPMYELSEEGYQAVIHRLTGLLATTIQELRDSGQTDRAMALASQAHDVLLSYDDDVAERVRFTAKPEDDEEGLGQAREEGLW